MNMKVTRREGIYKQLKDDGAKNFFEIKKNTADGVSRIERRKPLFGCGYIRPVSVEKPGLNPWWQSEKILCTKQKLHINNDVMFKTFTNKREN